MRLLLLLLHVWGTLHVSLSQNVTCPQPPHVNHGDVSVATKKTEYLEGDVVHYTCETGYISGLTIRYNCTAEGWQPIYGGKCYLKPCVLPEETPNGYYQMIKGEDFVFGTIIKYFCDEGYQMVSRVDTRTCLLEKWTNHVPVCEPLRCDLPPADGQVVVKGLPDNDQAILPDRFLRFSCEGPGKFLNGSPMLICGKDGQWDNPFPTCEDISCGAEKMHPYLRVTGLPRAGEKMKIGHKLWFECSNGLSLDGRSELTCLESGIWDASFPTCSEDCTVPDLDWSVAILTPLWSNRVRKGQKLEFGCRNRRHFLRGDTVMCLDNGQWSHPFPTCGEPLNCGKPPGLEDGDLTGTVRFDYRHGERVDYACQDLFLMRGAPYMTCENGEWVGRMECIKPCIVTEVDMRRHNIVLKHLTQQKIYAKHGDRIEFACRRGTRKPVSQSMVKYCSDGVIDLPTCY